MNTGSAKTKTTLLLYGAQRVLLGEKHILNEDDIKLHLSADELDKIDRITLGNRLPAASTTFIMPPHTNRPSIGLLSARTKEVDQNFLDESYYIERALKPLHADIGPLSLLLSKKISTLIWPDSIAVTAAERADILEWVKNGGFLIRFSGPNLAANTDDNLVPVILRQGQRSMQGAMTWEHPLRIENIPDESPFKGLTLQPDITVARQVLADPSPETFEKTWVQLEDGTPLITSGTLGNGTLVLIHTSAGPEWSNFCYSGFFVEALHRMVTVNTRMTGYKPQGKLMPLAVMNGYGDLAPPADTGLIQPLDPAKTFTPGPHSPPGIYGDAGQMKAFNIGDGIDTITPLNATAQLQTHPYSKDHSINFKNKILQAFACLLILDTIVSFILRGYIHFNVRNIGAHMGILFLVPLLMTAQAHAETEKGVNLAYYETGDASIDNTSYDGLKNLANALSARTTIHVKRIEALNPERDDASIYPFIYWPLSEKQMPLSSHAARNVQDYLSHGGLIVFDTRDGIFSDENRTDIQQSTPGVRALRRITETLQIPELMPLKKGHILAKSFYLLDHFPGRYDSGTVWVEKEPNPQYDSVTSVIIGNNNWASAWAFQAQDYNQRQDEMALRFGINITMTALTGNYKNDQIHIPYLLERMGQ